jgi:hypothetical protein
LIFYEIFRAENVRRYQQQYREQPMYKVSETTNWNQHKDLTQPLNFGEVQEQERRSREAAALAHQYVCQKLRKN